MAVTFDFDLDQLKQQVVDVVRYSQGYDCELYADDLINNWFNQKKSFIEAFDGKLIYEYQAPVSFQLTNTYKVTLVNEFISLIENMYHNQQLAAFIYRNRASFFENKVTDSLDTSVVPIGMKLIKAFKAFVPDKDTLCDIQDKASQIIQEDKLNGILCVSVHPLDFLSSSENNCNWTSCHSLKGEYRSGNLSYMQDSTTLIAYIKSGKNLVKLPNFPEEIPWNNKKWRVLLYVSDLRNMIMAGRQYPFATSGALTYIKDRILLRKGIISHGTMWTKWSDSNMKTFPVEIDDEGTTIDYRCRRKLVPAGDYLRPLDEIVEDCKFPLHFNDLLNSSKYTPMYAYQKDLDGSMAYGVPHFHVGRSVKCLCCGLTDINMSETFLCDECDLKYGTEDNELYTTCEHCGNRFSLDNGVWLGDDTLICPECARNYTVECEHCGEVMFESDMEFCNATNSYVCKNCRQEIEEEKISYGASRLNFA